MNETFLCELCDKEVDTIVGCGRCGRLVCVDCLAAWDEDDEPVCEECF